MKLDVIGPGTPLKANPDGTVGPMIGLTIHETIGMAAYNPAVFLPYGFLGIRDEVEIVEPEMTNDETRNCRLVALGCG